MSCWNYYEISFYALIYKYLYQNSYWELKINVTFDISIFSLVGCRSIFWKLYYLQTGMEFFIKMSLVIFGDQDSLSNDLLCFEFLNFASVWVAAGPRISCVDSVAAFFMGCHTRTKILAAALVLASVCYPSTLKMWVKFELGFLHLSKNQFEFCKRKNSKAANHSWNMQSEKAVKELVNIFFEQWETTIP